MAGIDTADWSTNSNDAVHISLVSPGEKGTKALHTFNPKFTYPIFGDEERIFGYQGLKINLKYNACDMRPSLQVTYTKKYKPTGTGETEATDLKAILEDFLPKTAFEKTSVFDTAISDPTFATWTPPGEIWQTIQAEDKTYEIWKGSLADPAVKQMIKRIQILVPMFIEGGTLVELDEPDWALERWTIFFLYQKSNVSAAPELSNSPYTFVGYSTVYRFYFYQNHLLSNVSPAVIQSGGLDFALPIPGYSFASQPCRSRISQFVILPPFHGGGNGSRFYNSIFDFYLKEPQTIEITVEDPNEAFDDLRDINDLARLRKTPEFAALRVNGKATARAKGLVPRDIVDSVALQKIRRAFKIAPRQFSRLVEMYTLSHIPTGIRQSLLPQQASKIPDLKAREHEYHLWQLLTKQRLYRHNKDSLMQLDRAERIEKLDDALGNVEADYARLLRTADERQSGKAVNGTNGVPSNGKRTSPFDVAEEEGEPSAKKIKFA